MKFSALLPLLGFLVLGGFFALGLREDPSEIKTQMINRPVPEFTLSSVADGDAVLTRDILVGQVSLVNVFGSWCAPCLLEHPVWTGLDTSERGFALIGVNWRDERDRAQNWLTQNGDPYDAVLFDDLSLLAIGLGVTGAPETFIVDKMGTVRYKHTGIVTPQIMRDTLMPVIAQLSEAP